jgi:hypothetical protein
MKDVMKPRHAPLFPKPIRVCLGAVVAGLLCAGCYPVRITTVPGAAGIIIDSNSLQPVRGAEVAVRNPRDNGQPVAERRAVSSKRDGRFSIAARHRWEIAGPMATLWTASANLEIRQEGYTPVMLPLMYERGTGGLSADAVLPKALGRVLPDDITEPAAFAAKLRAGNDPLSAYLYSRFSPDSQHAAAKPTVRRDILRSVLARELNTIVNGAGIYEADRFRGVTLSVQSAELLDHSRALDRLGLDEAAYREEYPQATTPGFVRALLNRRLLVDAYPDELRQAGAPGRRLDGNFGVILLDPVKNQTARN